MNCEIDIETLATCPTAAIIQIGGVKYDLESGMIRDELIINIDPRSSIEKGLAVHQETVDWWKNQAPEVKKSLRSNPDMISLEDALDILYNWIDPKSHVSCYGLNFDIPILENAFRACGYTKMPWKYSNLLCTRTISELYGVKPKRDEATHHNALHDARAQAQMLIDIFK